LLGLGCETMLAGTLTVEKVSLLLAGHAHLSVSAEAVKLAGLATSGIANQLARHTEVIFQHKSLT
jgi:hypothetical protein